MNKKIMLSWMKSGHLSVPKVLLKHYNDIGLTEKQLILLLNVYMATEEGSNFPTPEDLANGSSYSVEECSEILSQLVKNGFLELVQYADDKGMLCEYFSFDCLWDKLISFMLVQEETIELTKKKTEEINIYTVFEKEFSRPLSPIECETLMMWIDEDRHSSEVIKAALREAVVSNKLSFRYIDRILFEWKKNGIKTIEQARAYGEKFRRFQQQQKSRNVVEQRKNTTTFPAYNWLEQ